MISLMNYNRLKDNFGDVGSWAIWTGPFDTTKKNIGNLDCFNNEKQLLHILNPKYVFVGLNCAEHDPVPHTHQIYWGNFHSPDTRRTQDYKIRYALNGTRFYGAYMTDIIKKHSDKDSSNVKRYLIDHPDVIQENINIFKEEISCLNPDLTIIAFGGDAYKILYQALSDDYQIIKIMHYSNYIGPEKYREKILSQLKNV